MLFSDPRLTSLTHYWEVWIVDETGVLHETMSEPILYFFLLILYQVKVKSTLFEMK